MSCFKQFDLVGFISNILAVILGIVITFSIQGIIDSEKEKENVKSALTLVKEELMGCKSDLESCAYYLDRENYVANYFNDHSKNLKECPEDSLQLYWGLFSSEMILTLPDDALQLLKTSSLFSAIDDNSLSLKIIRAYDQCEALRQVFNRHESHKTEFSTSAYTQYGSESFKNEKGNFSISKFLSTTQGGNLKQLLMNQDGSLIRVGIKDLDDAITAIEEYL